jgi:hypothetical protein
MSDVGAARAARNKLSGRVNLTERGENFAPLIIISSQSAPFVLQILMTTFRRGVVGWYNKVDGFALLVAYGSLQYERIQSGWLRASHRIHTVHHQENETSTLFTDYNNRRPASIPFACAWCKISSRASSFIVSFSSGLM